MRAPNLLLHLVVAVAAGIAGSGASAQAPDIHSARKVFQQASLKKARADRQAGIDALVATKDIRVLEDLIAAADKAGGELARLRERISDTGEKMKEIWKNIDRQAGSGRPVSVGSVAGLDKKTKEVQDQLDKLNADQDDTEAWRIALLAGSGRLLDALDGPARADWVAGALSRIEKADKADDRLLLVSVLRSSRSGETRDAIVGLVARSPDDSLRTAAIDAASALGDPRTVPAVAGALQDDVWPVRVAAARALARITSVEGIGPLVAALEKAEGRFLEEVIQALEDLSGRTFHDNFTLWKEWWAKDGPRLTASFTALSGDDLGEKAKAVIAAGDEGFLAAIRLLLKQEGIGPEARPDAAGAAAAPAPAPPSLDGAPGDDPLAGSRRDAIVRGLGRLPAPIRDRAVAGLLIGPFGSDGDPGRRARYLRLMAPLAVDRVRSILRTFAGPDPAEDPRGAKKYSDADRLLLRKAALEALADHPHDDAALPLKAVFDLDGEKDLKLIAAASLVKLRRKASVEPLIRALNDKDAAVVAAAHQGLVELAGEDKGAAYAAWRDWWQASRQGFKVKGAEGEVAKKDEDKKPVRGTSFYGIETKSLHVIFILDHSGSMQETDAKGAGSRMDALKKEMTDTIRGLPESATFNMIYFSHDFDVWKKQGMIQATPENKLAATEWVKAMPAVGATNIFDPIERAFELAGRGTHDRAYAIAVDTIFLMTDGQPNRGRLIKADEILKEVARLNDLKKVKIHTVGVGEGKDGTFLRRLAEMTGGTYVER